MAHERAYEDAVLIIFLNRKFTALSLPGARLPLLVRDKRQASRSSMPRNIGSMVEDSSDCGVSDEAVYLWLWS